MNTFLLNTDNTVIHTVKSPVMEKTTNIEDLLFICEKEYNKMDMSTFDLVLAYKLPISGEVRVCTLVLKDDNYKEDYLLYVLPINAKNITGEVGEVQLSFNQMKVELDAETGEQKKYVRSFKDAYLNILPVSKFINLTDDGLTQIAELYLANKAQLEALQAYAEIIYNDKADEIVMKDDKVILSSNGKEIGEGISLEELNDKLVESGSLNNGNVKIISI